MSTVAPREESHRRPPGGRGAGRGPAGPAGRRPGPLRPSGRIDGGEKLRHLTRGFAQAFMEVESGRRPREQLYPILCPRLAERLAPVWVRLGPLGTVVSVYGRWVTPARYEAVAVVRRGQRFGALVVSLAYAGSCWRVVDAARPEDVVPRPVATALDTDLAAGVR